MEMTEVKVRESSTKTLIKWARIIMRRAETGDFDWCFNTHIRVEAELTLRGIYIRGYNI